MHMCYAYMKCMCNICIQCPWKVKGVRITSAGVTYGVELLYG